MAKTPPLFPIAPGKPVENRRGTVERTSDFSVQIQRVSGQVLVHGNGEVAMDVDFPVHFTEVPGMSFGGHLADNRAPQAGNFPTVSVVVHRWKTITRTGLGNFYYIGATLGIVVGGKADSLMFVHWHAEGPSFRNPVTPTGTLEETL